MSSKLLSAAFAAFMIPAVAMAGSYKLTVIAVPGAQDTAEAGLTDQGSVVGSWVDGSFGNHGFMYQSGKFTVVDVPGASGTLVLGVNNAGTMVGTYSDAASTGHGFTLSQGIATTHDVPQALFTTTNAINATGELAAYASVDKKLTDFIGTAAGFTEIGITNDSPVAINALGTVIANTFIYANGTMTPIAIPNAATVAAHGINDQGTIVGYYVDARTQQVAGFVLQAGKVTTLNRPGWAKTFLTGINLSGQICGYSAKTKQSSTVDAFVYSQASGFTSIAPGQNAFALAINRHGAVAGAIGNTAFLAVPVAP